MNYAIKRSKYRAVKTSIDGIKFDSKKEAKHYCELKLLERSGKITGLQLQVPFVLIPKNENGRAVKYVADFVYYENGVLKVVDVKGFKTDVYKLKKRLMKEKYDIEVIEI